MGTFGYGRCMVRLSVMKIYCYANWEAFSLSFNLKVGSYRVGWVLSDTMPVG